MRVRETRRPPHHGSRLAASVTAGMEAGRATSAMGLAFPNPLGLAAGVDRTGALIPSLNAHGFGHIEIGTITPARGYAGALGRRDARTRIGVNIGSARHGLDDQVIEDYAATLRQVYGLCDYIVANLSAPTPHRDGNTPGVETLVKRLGVARDVLSAVGGHRVPLLLKLEAGRRGTPFPTAVLVMRSAGIDGVVLVSEDLDRIRAIATHLDGLTVISVGGVQTAEDVQARIAAGASLVQVHRAFADGGAARIRRILRGLATTSVERHP